MCIFMFEKLEFKVYTRRHSHRDTYEITRIPSGWHVKFLVHTGDCNPRGEPYLYSNFLQDHVSYPHNLGVILEQLWQHADELKKEQLQEKINDIAEWVNACEHAHPNWNGYY